MLKISKSADLEMIFVNLYSHKSVYKIHSAGNELIVNESNYTFFHYLFATGQISLLAKRALKKQIDVENVVFDRTGGVLTTKSGVSGRFENITNRFELTYNFMPGNCYCATKDVLEQLKKKGEKGEFLILEMDEEFTHAVARAYLKDFVSPVIIDASYSLIMEEELYFNIFDRKILKTFDGKDVDKMFIGYNTKKGEQMLCFEKPNSQDELTI